MEAATRGKRACALFRFSFWTRNVVGFVRFSAQCVVAYAREQVLKFRYIHKAELSGSG